MQAFKKFTRRRDELNILGDKDGAVQGKSLSSFNSSDNLSSAKNDDSSKADGVSTSGSESASPRLPLAKDGSATKLAKGLFKRSKSAQRLALPSFLTGESVSSSKQTDSLSRDSDSSAFASTSAPTSASALPPLPPSSSKPKLSSIPSLPSPDGGGDEDQILKPAPLTRSQTFGEGFMSKPQFVPRPDGGEQVTDHLTATPQSNASKRGSFSGVQIKKTSYISKRRPLSSDSFTVDFVKPVQPSTPDLSDVATEKPKPLTTEEKSRSPSTEKPFFPVSGTPTLPISEEPILPNSEKPLPPSSEKPLPPSSEKPLPPSSEKPLPPSSEKPLPPSSEKPLPPSSEKPLPLSSEKPLPPSSEKPLPLSDEKPLPLSVQKPRPPSSEKPLFPRGEKPRRASADRSWPSTTRKLLSQSTDRINISKDGNPRPSSINGPVIIDFLSLPAKDYASINGSTEKLQHLNQQRPKGPNRRPPSAVFKENMRNSSESDSNGGISLGSPSISQKSPGIGAFSKEGSSDSPASKPIAEETESHIPPSSILLRVNSKKSATSSSSSGSSPAAAPSSGSPAPARSPHTKRTSLLAGTTGTQPAVPWLQELNAKQQRKSQLLELEREASFAPTPVSPKPVPPTPKKPGDTQSNKSPGSGDVIRPVSFLPVKPVIEEKHPQQPDLISTTRKASAGKADVPSNNVSSTVDGPSKITDGASKTTDKPTKVSGGLSSGIAKDASPSVGATAAMLRQLQQQQQQQPTLSSSSRGSIISVSSIASSQSSSSSSNVQQNKPSIEPAIAPSALVLAAPVQLPPSAPTQPPPAQVLAAPGVAKAAPVPVVAPPPKVVEPPTQNTPSHLHSSSSSNAVTHAPHAILSTKPPVSAPAPTAPPEVPSDSTDSAKPPPTNFKLDEVIDSVLEKVLPKVKELEGRLEDQHREHARQMQLLTEELDDERKKRACLEIELERLKRTMNNYAAHV